ncbi:5-(carboxyamino)imidazole ribonucleotide synthase [Radiobacillus kanasensis]|uniref:5-(carboxyamino)imidazole ribonucleotide synthase n=1 Tax=Radiobacillus kanasensis TaxID=2844358 RepID=UPI001E616A0A|nr:5-(carboxyamino)imidazole ribonucleotide synthase [Radiobacillus kanasensis]UFT99906.1 5-(carboxyamino)imidazole ribonucleotide synthase [Radiobacillus kanasensis]
MQPNKLLPGSTIGILGGGQLGRMMAIAAKYMGYRVTVLDPTEDCPTAQVSDHQILAKYDDLEAIKQLAEASDVITYEFENVDLEAAKYLEERNILPQGARLLKITQDREQEKQAVVDSGLEVPPYRIVSNVQEVEAVLNEIKVPCVIKTCRGGYDGKGQLKITEETSLEKVQQFVEQKGRCIIENWVPFNKEISVVFTRAITGEMTIFPIAENEHKDHILHTTSAPALISTVVERKAIESAEKLANHINVVGTFAIEMFVKGEDVYINEMAPRPHNSGHYTIEACNVSQFEQHIRAITGLPLVPISFHGGAIMLNLLGEELEKLMNQTAEIPAGHLHVYGKDSIKPKRKMGHLTMVGASLDEVKQRSKEIIENFYK